MCYRSVFPSVALLFWLVAPCVSFGDESETEHLDVQPASKHSYIISKNSTITDTELAKWMQTLLAPEGQVRVHDATFIFQECFGGGMLDNLRSLFGRGLIWVGGSASKHTQGAVGQLTSGEAAVRPADVKTPSQFVSATPRSAWSEALVPEIGTGQTMLNAFKAAELTDIVGPHAVAPFLGLEHPQWSSGPGGELVVLTDGEAESRHAVLWAGQGNRWRHFHNIEAMRAALIAKWGATAVPYTIEIFYGFGTKDPANAPLPVDWHARRATGPELRSYLTALGPTLDDHAQFFFYATGHGGSSTKLPPPPAVLTPGTSDTEEFTLSPADLDLMAREPENEPLIAITYEDYLPVTGEATVTLNGVLLGTIPPVTEPGSTTVQFVVSESLLASVNTVVVSNDSDVDLILTESENVTGGIDDDPPIGIADFDGDGDADLNDLATFQLCATGPGINYWPDLPPGRLLVPNADHLIASDFDRDGDVDMDDFGVFQRCFSGGEFFTHPDCAF